MHRAGTSLIARVANLLGVYLGPKEHMMKPKKDNPTGFWENQLITDLNDEILSRFGGTWDRPPTLPKGWEKSPKIADLRRRAQRIVREDFGGAKLWGWKDPRTCLTLPFWQRLLPGMRYVICLRNPVDVAKSLERRNGFPLEKSANLWLSYMRSALEHTSGEPRLLVSYEDFVTNWQEELPRLSKFLGRARQTQQANVKKAVRRFVREDLQHHRTDIVNVIQEHRVPFPTKALFTVLRAYASIKVGRIDQQGYQELQEGLDVFSQHSAAAQDDTEHLKTKNSGLAQDLAGRSTELIQTRADLAKTSTDLTNTRMELIKTSTELANVRAELSKTSTDLTKTRAELEVKRTRQESELAEKNITLDALRSELQEMQSQRAIALEELDLIRHSFGYKVMRFYGSLIDRLLPDNTLRGESNKSTIGSVGIGKEKEEN